jgi:hypothetical protein
MTINPRDWDAQRDRTRNYFAVAGSVAYAATPQADGGYIVPSRARLLKVAHQPLLPDILTLRLYVEQERHSPYTPPPQPPALQAMYYPPAIETEEDVCTKVRIMHSDDTLIELAVKDDPQPLR